MIEVVSTGLAATIQDLGRPGFAGLGVGRSGAFDRTALRLANRLVGNPPGAPGLEVLGGGLRLMLARAATVALTGASCRGDLDWGRATTLPAGARVSIGPATDGIRAYLAIRGGVVAQPQLGSCSTDQLGQLGPRPLRDGDELDVGPDPGTEVDGATAVRAPFRGVLRVVIGPREDWFAPRSVLTLTSVPWTVRPDSDRVGIRLDGPRLERSRAGELASEPTLPGGLQVPPDGRPILLGPDAPVTGGYSVIAVVRDTDLDFAAQLRPGQTLRFS